MMKDTILTALTALLMILLFIGGYVFSEVLHGRLDPCGHCRVCVGGRCEAVKDYVTRTRPLNVYGAGSSGVWNGSLAVNGSH